MITKSRPIYVCETCQTEHDSPDAIQKCELCGADICENCWNVMNFFLDEDYYSDGRQEYSEKWLDTYICNDCNDRIVVSDEDVEEMDNEIDKFIQEETIKLVRQKNMELRKKLEEIVC